MKTVNIGILAHVDAGKTSLTERLLFEAGVIDSVGRVDDGNTRTDTMELERQRGITIQSAVVALTLGDTKITIIDTPGHAEFISEVERALRVLDGAILVVSAVEGIQAQTKVLARALRRVGIPYLVFVNKVDRVGARTTALLTEIRSKLDTRAVAMNAVSEPGKRSARAQPYTWTDAGHLTRLADVLADGSDAFLRAYLEADGWLSPATVRAELAAQTGLGRVRPVYFGSAMVGTGIGELVEGVRDLLPASVPAPAGGTSGSVFKIERGSAGEKVAYVRLRSGSIAARSTVALSRRSASGPPVVHRQKVTGIRTFADGDTHRAERVVAGDIALLLGLTAARVGDLVGAESTDSRGIGDVDGFFAPPTLETVVSAIDPAHRPRLAAALDRLGEQDPLINTKLDEERNALVVSLYGEVQKEVLQARLADEFGVAVRFSETRTVHVERTVGVGEAVTEMGETPFYATVGLRLEPLPVDSGIRYSQGNHTGHLPRAFHTAVEETVYDTLRHGRYGWEVHDCAVTLIRAGYESPISTAADFRQLTPRVLRTALDRAGTRVYEPVNRFDLEIPPADAPVVLARLTKVGGQPRQTDIGPGLARVDGLIPVRSLHLFERDLPGLTHGEGVFLSEFDSFQPVLGPLPRREPVLGLP